MFLILALIVATASAYAYDMSRHNRSVVVHRLFQTSAPKNPICPRPPLNVTRHNASRLPQGYRLPEGYKVPNNTTPPLPNKTVAAKPAPAPAPRALRH